MNIDNYLEQIDKTAEDKELNLWEKFTRIVHYSFPEDTEYYSSSKNKHVDHIYCPYCSEVIFEDAEWDECDILSADISDMQELWINWHCPYCQKIYTNTRKYRSKVMTELDVLENEVCATAAMYRQKLEELKPYKKRINRLEDYLDIHRKKYTS